MLLSTYPEVMVLLLHLFKVFSDGRDTRCDCSIFFICPFFLIDKTSNLCHQPNFPAYGSLFTPLINPELMHSININIASQYEISIIGYHSLICDSTACNPEIPDHSNTTNARYHLTQYYMYDKECLWKIFEDSLNSAMSNVNTLALQEGPSVIVKVEAGLKLHAGVEAEVQGGSHKQYLKDFGQAAFLIIAAHYRL
ncbi:Spectrin Beta Chain, Erythrocytic [Manis pentadactyla]|nr:Spectrin Beta Chain, Erythrocytic [Manis pentadactyla]